MFRAWRALREKKAQLAAAQDETSAKRQRLTERHATLAAQVEKDKENREAAKQQARDSRPAQSAASREDSKAVAETARSIP